MAQAPNESRVVVDRLRSSIILQMSQWGLTQRAVAREARISRETLNRIICGRSGSGRAKPIRYASLEAAALAAIRLVEQRRSRLAKNGIHI